MSKQGGANRGGRMEERQMPDGKVGRGTKRSPH